MLVHYVVPLLLGTGIGFFSGLFGVSGGILAIPSMVFLGHAQQVAQGTSLVMQLPNIVLGAWQYARRGALDVRAGLTLAAAALPTTFVGAFAATHWIPSRQLRLAFGSFFLVMATYTLWNALRARKQLASLPLRWDNLTILGALSGLATGMFGIGGAALAIPSLVIFFGVPQTVAQGLALFLMAPGSIVGLATYAHADDVDWGAGIGLAAGASLLVGAGVHVAHVLPEKAMRVLFAGFIYVMSILLLLRH